MPIPVGLHTPQQRLQHTLVTRRSFGSEHPENMWFEGSVRMLSGLNILQFLESVRMLRECFLFQNQIKCFFLNTLTQRRFF